MSATKNRSISLAGPLVCLIMAAIVLIACGDVWMSSDHATLYLVNHGYTEVQTTGSRAFFCGHNGPGAVGFKAKNKDGRQVTGAVCENSGGGIMVMED